MLICFICFAYVAVPFPLPFLLLLLLLIILLLIHLLLLLLPSHFFLIINQFEEMGQVTTERFQAVVAMRLAEKLKLPTNSTELIRLTLSLKIIFIWWKHFPFLCPCSLCCTEKHCISIATWFSWISSPPYSITFLAVTISSLTLTFLNQDLF